MKGDRELVTAPTGQARAPGRGFRVARWVLRSVLTVTAVLVVLQPISIGQYLQGRYAMLAMHADVADVVDMVALLGVVVAIWYAIAGGRVWVAVVVGALWLAIGLQLGMGYAHQLGIHVPLGVAIVGGTIALAVWSWTPASARFRARRAGRTVAEVPANEQVS